MKLHEMTRAQFDERLRGRSESDLAKMAKGFGLAVPSGSGKSVLLDLIFDGLQAQATATGTGGANAATQGASPLPKEEPLVPVPRFSVLCATKHKQYWKFGFKFTHEWQDVPQSQFTDEQWEFLCDREKCPHVRVKDLQVVVQLPAETPAE